MLTSNKALIKNRRFTTSLTPCLALTMCLAMLGCSKPSNIEQTSDKSSIKEALLPTHKKIAEVEIINPSTFVRKDEPIYFSYYDLGISAPTSSDSIEVFHQENQLPTQHIDSDYDGKNDGILFLIDLLDNQTNTVTINNNSVQQAISPPVFKKRVQAEISHKVGGQWLAHTKPAEHLKDKNLQEYQGGKFQNVSQLTPPDYYSDHSNWIRYEGPGIESDKVAYRFYLDWRNGFDIFGKLTKDPILGQIGQDGYESYHHMQPWGMDILKVGGSLGAGGFGFMSTSDTPTLEHVKDVTKRQAIIAEDGNIQSRVNINYVGWKNSLNTQNLTANISMVAGSRLAKVHLGLEKDLPNITAGVVKHQGSQFIQGEINTSAYQYSYIASWGKQSLDGSLLGMAIFFKKGQLIKVLEDDKNYLVQLKPRGKSGETTVEYYFASVWQPESGIDNKKDFIAYLAQEAEKLTRKPRVYLSTALTEQAHSMPLTAESALNWGKALADAELNRKALGYFHNGWDVNRARKPKFEYDIIGLQPFTFDLLADVTGDEKYRQVNDKVTASFITNQGKILSYHKKNFNIDNIPPGRNLLKLYQRTNDEKFRLSAAALRQQLTDHPKTSEGAFWHKNRYPNQLWLDGVYMGMPFLAEYAMMFEQGHQQQESLHEVVNEFKLTRKYLRDAKSGLYYHGWDESKNQSWANKTTGQSPEFWARGVGWLAMALVDVLDSIPEKNVDDRAFLIEMINELAVDIAKVQDKTSGAWWQVLDKPNEVGNYKESSATAMFSYFFAKAINNGYLTDEYNAVAQSAFKALINEFTILHLDGATSMTNQCYVAGLSYGRDGSYDYYMNEPISVNDPKGTGPYILASMEMYKLLK